MTTKYLTGAYPGGYTVANNVSFLDIESTASIGGTGIVGPTAATSSIQITNNGTVRATIGYGYGIDIFQTGANIVNGQSNYSALIEGSKIGISGSNTTVTNFGMIEGLGASYAYAGVVLGINSAVTNGSAADTGALIEGSEGISGRWSTVRNFGSIVGKNDTAVYFGGGNGSNSVMVANGSQADRVAHIQGAYNGVFLRYTIGTVTNYGIISAGGGEGVALLYGGLINNFGMITATGASGTGVELRGKVSVFNGSAQDTTASIAGVAVGITSSGNLPATIVNYGTVLGTGSSGYGIVLATGGRIRNGSLQDSAALIQGGKGGVSLQSNRATIVNFGTIVGGALGGGVMMSGANDILINGAPTHTMALIGGGGASVVSGTADTITNYGTISGLSLTSTTDVLKVEAGSVFETPV
ncbi:MAG: hypothetical protein ABI306_08050, partial [Caulobacteraceae bacterium]